MLTAYYVHRLPADYDLDIIRNRVRERGRLWDDTPDLVFKGFLLREAGRYGATENGYASLYLWRNEQAFAGFVTDGRYRVVTDSFGRAPIDVQVALDARKGSASTDASCGWKPSTFRRTPTSMRRWHRRSSAIATWRRGRVRCGRRQPRSAALAADARARIGAGAGRRRRGHGVPGFASGPAVARYARREWGVMAGAVFRSRAGPAGEPCGPASARLPAGLVIVAHLAGLAVGIAAIAALATVLALLFR